MYQRQDSALLCGIYWFSGTRAEVIGQPALDAFNGIKTAGMRDISCLRCPWRNRSQPRHNKQQISLLGDLCRRRAIGQQAIENLALRWLQRRLDLNEMPIFGGNAVEGRD